MNVCYTLLYTILTVGIVEIWDFGHHKKYKCDMSDENPSFLTPIITNVLHSFRMNKVRFLPILKVFTFVFIELWDFVLK